jgi:hypothetical protein
MTYDATRIVENRRQFDEKVAEIESNEDLSERGKEKLRTEARKEHTARHKELWTEADEADAHEVERLESKVYKLSYPSSVITPGDRERYAQDIRSTRMHLATMPDEQLEQQMSRSLKEGDRVLSQACYLESLHRSGGEGTFNEALGLQGGASYRAAEAFRNANPNARKSYDQWRAAKAQREDPNNILMRGMHKAMGPQREAGDSQGDGAEFLANLFSRGD